MKRNFMAATLVAIAAVGLYTNPALATVFYDNGVTTLETGIDAGNTFPIVADDFVVPTGITSFDTIEWTGGYRSNAVPVPPEPFIVRIYQDLAGMPSPTVSEQRIGEVENEYLLGIGQEADEETGLYSYTLHFGPITVVPGQIYWLSIMNQSAGDWIWAGSTGGNSSVLGPGGWSPSSPALSLDFRLSNDPVPLPASLPLLLAGLVLVRRRAA